jgi:hypothetical protein
MLLGRTLAALLSLVAAHSQAAPKLTTVQDVLYKADGTRFTGTLTISWNQFDAADTSVVGLQSLTVNVSNGSLYVQLIPTTDAAPAGAYNVQYQSDGREQFQELWAVPPATHPLRVRDVRTVAAVTTNGGSGSGTGSGSGGTGGVAPAQPITEDTVIGLPADLAVRPLKGLGFANGRAAVVNDTGGIEAVAGNLSDCVHVDGTSGACFDSSLLPAFIDAEMPGGVVDGANNNFALAGTPSPSTSLQLFRNGLAMNPGSDFNVSGSTVTFFDAAIPQPGDTLVAWYRATSTGSLSAGGLKVGGLSGGTAAFAPAQPQVLCSAEGTSTGSFSPVSLGHCSVPAHILMAGDRVQIRATVVHQGSVSPYNLQLNWGTAALETRAVSASETVFSLVGDVSLTASSSIWTGQSYGQGTPSAISIGVATSSVAAAVRVDFLMNLAAASSSDRLSLANYTVIRYPSISHP